MPEDDLVHFVIEAVASFPLESFRVNHRGTGDKQFSEAGQAERPEFPLPRIDRRNAGL